MKKIIRETDEKRGIVQITVADERWYTKPGKDRRPDIPVYTAVPIRNLDIRVLAERHRLLQVARRPRMG